MVFVCKLGDLLAVFCPRHNDEVLTLRESGTRVLARGFENALHRCPIDGFVGVVAHHATARENVSELHAATLRGGWRAHDFGSSESFTDRGVARCPPKLALDLLVRDAQFR